MTSAREIHRRVLDNGLTVIVEQRGLGPAVFSGVVYRVGSRDEEPGITGISHLLEHMMFKGTQRFGKGEIAALVERNGGELNAFTTEDVTMYHEVFASDRWELALEIEAERMVNLRIDPEELESERQVVLEERLSYRDIPSVELNEELMGTAFRSSPYRWPIIGSEEDIRSMDHDAVLRHYRRYYSPANAALVVCGDVTADEVFRSAECHFGAIPPGESPARSIPEEPEWTDPPGVDLARSGRQSQLQLLFRAPRIHSRESEALLLLGCVLSGSRTARLDLALLETGLAGDVYFQYHAKADPGSLLIGAEPTPGTAIEQVEEILWQEIDRVAHESIPQEELERARTCVEAAQVYAMQSPSTRGFTLAWHEAHGDVGYTDRLVDQLRSLEAGEVRDLARRLLRRSGCARGRVLTQDSRGGPGSAPPPPAEQGVSLHGVFCPRRRFATGLGAVPAARRSVLRNGVRVLLQPDSSDPFVSLSMVLHGGAAFDPPGREGLAGLTAAMLERGPEGESHVQFMRRFESIGSHLTIVAGRELVHVSCRFLSRHAETVLEWIGGALRTPALRAGDLEVIRALALSDLESRAEDLSDVAEDLFIRGVAGDHPFSRLPHGTKTGVEAVTPEDLRAFFAAHYRPDGAHLALVGDFDPERMERALAREFGSIALPDSPRESLPPFRPSDAARTWVESRPEKGQAKIYLGGKGFGVNDPDRFAGVTLNLILGGSAIRSRLGDTIRDDRGLAYTVYSRNYECSSGGFFTVCLGTRPENVLAAVEAVREQLDRLVSDGVTDTELEDAQSFLTGSFPLLFTTYGRLSRFWAMSSVNEWPEDYLGEYRGRIRALTKADLERVAKRLARGAKVLAVAGPVDEGLAPVGGVAHDGS
ncbi:MAG: pitrilysin family protein [Gemmatimonadota bacterium]|nr:pitrilysin family protein [Gemmatimonadota bacterium]MDP7032564.1 pitrilysin family protein [Gemmatimonadota bacterium]